MERKPRKSRGFSPILKAINESDIPAAGKPNSEFSHGFFSFNITVLTEGQTVNITIVDDGGPGLPRSFTEVKVPALNLPGLVALGGALGVIAVARIRKQVRL